MDIIKNTIRDVPDFPIPGIIFKDITPVLLNPEAFAACVEGFAERYRDMKIDVIAAVESRGFLFGAPLAKELGIGMAIVRKPGKLPGDTIETSYDLEYGSATLQLHKDAVQPGQRVLVIDDLLATGGTAAAAGSLIAQLGGEVVEQAFVVELSFLAGRKALGDVPIFALVTY